VSEKISTGLDVGIKVYHSTNRWSDEIKQRFVIVIVKDINGFILPCGGHEYTGTFWTHSGQ